MEKPSHNFVVGTTLQLELADTKQTLVPALLIGYVTGRSLLVTLPAELADAVRDGMDCVVRFESGDNLYAFDSQIVHCAMKPFAYVHLAYPQQAVEPASVRRSQRVTVNDMVMMLVMEEAGRKMSVALADISLSGARLVTGVRLGDIGERFSIEIPQLGGGTTQRIALPCQVRYVREEQSSTVGGKRVYHHGVEFTDLNQQALVFIERYIGDKVAEHRGVRA